MDFTSIEEFVEFFNSQLQSSLEKDVAPEIIKVAQDHVQKDVYDAYDSESTHPDKYIRTGQLKNDFITIPIMDGIKIINTRSEDGRDIVDIIETGVGYKYTGSMFGKEPYDYEKPRLFIENTDNELETSKIAEVELIKSLERKGFKMIY
jgi:hypothetical protein